MRAELDGDKQHSRLRGTADYGAVTNAVLILGQRQRQCASFKPALGQWFYILPNWKEQQGRHETLTKCWFNIGPVPKTLGQH